MKQITEEDFRGLPKDVTDLAIFDGEDGELYGWGHIEPSEFLAALPAIAEYHGLKDGEFDDVGGEDISYTYAKPHPDLSDKELDDDEWAFVFCAKEDEGSFPVTYLHL